MPSKFCVDCWSVLSVFLIPFGGGIPSGVIMAKNRELVWYVTATLYLISDILLAFVFEGLMLLFIRYTRDSAFTAKFIEQYKKSLERMGFHAGLSPSWYSLVMISFGVDPMTGRAVARAAGHGFVMGWFFAICGDMIFFALLMASTLWLNNILGDGTAAALIVLAGMFIIPVVIRRVKELISKPQERN